MKGIRIELVQQGVLLTQAAKRERLVQTAFVRESMLRGLACDAARHA